MQYHGHKPVVHVKSYYISATYHHQQDTPHLNAAMEAGEESDEDIIPCQMYPCGDFGEVYVVTLPEQGSRRRRKWVFCRQLEQIVFGTSKHSSNLYFDVNELGLESAVRNYDSQNMHHMSRAELKELMVIFNEFRRKADPLCGVAKKTSLVPFQVAVTLALHRRHRQLLTCLGQRVPPEWQRADQQAANTANDEVDLVLDEQVEEDQVTNTVEDAYETAIQAELIHDVEMVQNPEDEKSELARNYGLKEADVSKELQSQIARYRQHRTKVLNSWREGSRVQENTADNDIRTLLRYLGWCQFARHCEGIGLNFAIFMHEDSRSSIDEFVAWLQNDRDLRFSSIASYINGIMGCIQFTALEVSKEEETLGILNDLYSACFNLRAQCETQAREDRMYQKRHPQWQVQCHVYAICDTQLTLI